MNELEEYAGNDDAFALWLKNIDKALTIWCGLGILCLPDQCYRDMFEDGYNSDDVISDMRETGDLW